MRKTRTRNDVRRLFADAPRPHLMVGAALVAIVALLGVMGWLGYTRITALEEQNEVLDMRLASTTELIGKLGSALTDELAEERSRIAILQSLLDDFQEEVGDISGDVSTLEKLSKTDKELLQKYSRVFFLNEHYAPEDVRELPNNLKYSEQRPLTIHTRVYPHLKDMLEEAADDSVELFVFSAYRPFSEQKALNNQYTVIYGKGTANEFSAQQGYSEHQLGTAVDLITTGIGGTLEGFGDTEAYEWLRENAHRFGFTLSYPEENSYYVFEPWHWRFVGVALATHLYDTDQDFYDLSQRKIDEYIVDLFE